MTTSTNQELLELLTKLLTKRSGFYAKVILADLQNLPHLQGGLITSPSVSDRPFFTSHNDTKTEFTPTKVNPVIQPQSINLQDEVQQTVIKIAAQKTGFTPESINLEYRLLDDLNLDSIKATSFMNELAKIYHLEGKFEPSQFANATLSEIIEAIASYLHQSSPQKFEPQSINLQEKVRETVIKITEEKTGFTPESIKLEYRLLDDLNLDSIKATSFMNELAKIYNLEGKFEPSQFANSTLSEIIEAIASYLHQSSVQKTAQESETTILPSDVRSFTVELVKTELITDIIATEKTVKNVAIACLNYHQNLAQSLGNLWDGFNIPERLLILIPQGWEYLTEIIAMLANVAQKTADKTCELGFIQFGNGYFSRCNFNDSHSSIFSVVSFAASLHLERPNLKIRVLQFDPSLSTDIINQKIKAEFNHSDRYYAAGYNRDCERHQMVYDLAHKTSQSRIVNLSQEDVVIVTGGAKGITAECAFTLAKKYNCKMALVGSSPLNNEVQNTLKKYTDSQLIAKYYSCNITDEKAIYQLIQDVTNELGIITAVIHGAGINKPRKIDQVSATEAYEEIAPKLIGAWNLIAALKSHQLKYFIAFTSIIGVTGMLGNSWYAFSNETLDLLLRNFKKQTQTEIITLAYSVWSELGMGAKMGSTKTLANMGIEAISPNLGVAQFLHWIENFTDDQQIVIAAKLGGLDTWKRKIYDAPIANRYLEKIEYFEPGIELIVRCSLDRKHDLYVDDHNFNGSLLFPTVFGLEAMTQTASYVTGITNINSVKFEHISLLLPIVVPETGVIKIQLHAKVNNDQVFVAISTEESNYQTVHFSAVITLNSTSMIPPSPLNKGGSFTPLTKGGRGDQTLTKGGEGGIEPLHLDPKTDLYSWLLFQGNTYQNIDKVYMLNSQKVLLSTKDFHTDTAEICFSSDKLAPFILGNPLLRDVLLQSGQIPLTQNVYLPVNIEIWEIFNLQQSPNKAFVECTVTKVEKNTAFTDVVFVNGENEVMEKISGYQVKALKSTPEYPQPNEIGDRSFIENKITEGFKSYAHLLTDQPQLIVYKHSELFNNLDSETRHHIAQQVLHNPHPPAPSPTGRGGVTVPSNEWNSYNQTQITWLDSGKPQITNSNLQISISHSRSLLLMTIGQNIQGCDLEFVEQRTLDQWLELLGNQYQSLLEQFKNYDDTLCSFATRLWCVKESIFKATGIFPQLITVEMKHEKGVIFTVQIEGNSFHVLTFSVNIWPKNIGIVSMIVNLVGVVPPCLPITNFEAEVGFGATTGGLPLPITNLGATTGGLPLPITNLGATTGGLPLQIYSQREKISIELLTDPKYPVKLLTTPTEETFGIDPETGKMFATFYTTFKDCRAFWSKTYFVNFFAWIGQFREIGIRPLADKIRRPLESAEYGLVTNDSSTTIVNEAKTQSKIVVYAWTADKTDYNRSFLDMECEWFKQDQDGKLTLLATSRLSTTWVKIVGHGVVKQSPLPEYFPEFFDRMRPLESQPNTIPSGNYISINDIGSLKYESTPGPRPAIILNSKVYQTSLYDGNAVGNLYYSNYYDWQAKNIENFIHKLMPELFIARGKQGEYICLECQVNHLQEAMPFEEIEVNMYLEKWFNNGFKLYFEYYSLTGGKRKLAYGNNTLIWAFREDETAKPVACELPKVIEDYFGKLL